MSQVLLALYGHDGQRETPCKDYMCFCTLGQLTHRPEGQLELYIPLVR